MKTMKSIKAKTQAQVQCNLVILNKNYERIPESINP